MRDEQEIEGTIYDELWEPPAAEGPWRTEHDGGAWVVRAEDVSFTQAQAEAIRDALNGKEYFVQVCEAMMGLPDDLQSATVRDRYWDIALEISKHLESHTDAD